MRFSYNNNNNNNNNNYTHDDLMLKIIYILAGPSTGHVLEIRSELLNKELEFCVFFKFMKLGDILEV